MAQLNVLRSRFDKCNKTKILDHFVSLNPRCLIISLDILVFIERIKTDYCRGIFSVINDGFCLNENPQNMTLFWDTFNLDIHRANRRKNVHCKN